MASRLPAVTRLLAAVLLAAAFTSGAFQLDDEDLMFDDEDGTRSEAPVAAPMQDGVLGPLSRPKRQFLPYDSNDYVDYTDGSGSGFPPQIYMVKIHILRPWDSRFSNKGGAAFKEFKNEIMQPMQQVLHRVHRDATLEVDSIREGPSGQCMARLVVSMPDHEDRRENLVRNVRNELTKGRLGQLIVNTDYFEVTDYSGDVDNGDASSRVTGGCAADSIFTCKSGKIICDVQMCDGTEDCPDGDDEDGCGCEAGQFLCDSIRCQDESMKCDGIPDCADGTDEFNCGGDTTTIPGPLTTTSTRLQCLTDSTPQVCDDGVTLACFCDENPQCPNGEDESVANCGSDCPSGKVQCGTEPTCIESRFVCDGFQDCRNNWDEENCSVCPPGEQQCGDELTCVSSARICDGYSDCRNNWDEEQNCPLTCPPNMQMCREGRNCLAPNQICDGTPDCPEGSDEQECHICLVTQFQCDDGKCIENYRRCDHIADCVNAEDEAVCPCEHPNFQCISLMCIPPEAHCDGKVDCDDGSDEIGCLCPEGYFRCFTGGNCINVTYRCDGLVQCPDGSDEEDCPCQVWQWTCRDGGCISQASRCDGTIDCNDKSDEYECPSGGCREGEFKCQSGSCVLEEDRCDGVNQCPDGSDEFGCPTPTCGPLEFTCADGKCVPAERKCDGYQDCADDSDEYSCCSSGQFQCGDGSCVPESARCNNVRDCPDDSDETDCPVCHPDEWRCRDGNCVPAEVRCDGYPQCLDHSDEHNCPVPCSDEEWTCIEGSCIPQEAWCDGRIDCPDGSDEADCTPQGCKTDEWTCRDGSCLPIEGRCDGYHQCWDSSDEENCPPKCRPDEFTCWDGSCVPDYLRCDGSPHCPDSSDEAECYPSTCTSNQWTCSDGSCIPQEKRCDQRYDCPDYTDEYNCTGCSSQEWTCLDRSCIPLENHCNGRYDCLDRSDEENCIASECRPDEFRCVSDYSCIPKSSQCNGLQECRDGSDEEQCAPRPTCKADEFACADDGTCIPSYLQCDGRPYCRDASDEHNCPSSACRVGEFRCSDGTCIPDHLVCDGQRYCWDGSDEWGCPTCRPDQFRCDDGKCLEQWQKCNTISECSQGEDERSCRPPLFNCKSGQQIDQQYRCNGQVECPFDQSDEEGCPCRPEDHLCERDGTCIAGSKVCDGRPDCSDASDELNCPLCGRDEWQCLDGQCIHRSYHCDGRQDCLDNSDESVDCTPRCKTTEFKCGDGSCIPDHFLCDTRFDCTDGSDEHNCECKQDEFHCNSGECVPRTVECDGKPDCRDGSDEGDYCPTPSPCTANEFHCQSGECVSQFVVCDGRGDCFDGSDELQCPDGQPGTGTCSESEFKCRDGSCVDRSAYCDRIPDCRDGSDEDNCTRQCASGEFQCTDRQCIRQESVCNRVRDCYDGSDEVNCPTLPPPPPPPTETTTTTYCRGDQFQCGSGDCIPQFYVCDGPRDCRDGSDEDSCTTTSGFTTSTTTTPPPQNTFQCQDGRIINRQQRCDGRRDCSDGSDEIDCPVSGRIDLKTFPDEQTSKQTQEVVFQCRDEGTTRAPVRWERDRGRPLPEGSTDIRGRLTMPRVQMEHEGVYYCVAQGVSPNTPGMRKPVYLRVEPYEVITASPPVVCSLLEATCRSGECINKTQVCDGRPDCKDSSDEDRCGRCEPNEFQCDNRKCVLKTWLCDSDNDCGDNSDEQYCGISDPDAFCHNNEFMCRSGSQCIPKSFHCDGDNDCMDLSDEDGCRKPEVKEPPPRNVMVWVGETFNITCRVEGVPTPIVLWRLNWGHVPAKCQMTSKNGFGMLVCPDAQPTDQGAYSCEAINGKGSVFATPDAIVVVKGIPINQCQPPSFNSLAISQEDCLSCFCFGITNDCFSTDMFITQLPPPNGDSFTLVGANQDQTQGNYVVRDNDYPLSSRHLAYNLPGTQYSDRVVLNVDRSKLRGPGDLAVYFSLPDSHKRQQLASFGGYLRYRITYSHFGASQTTSHPDVIIRGNGLTLMHVHDGTFQENIENWVDVRFFYGHWFKRVVQWGGRIKVEQPASREDIMMVLENMDLLLIRAQYTDGDFINTTLSNVQMDTAEISRNDQGQAGLVEKCVCPPGYTGISCQDCAPNYTRVKEGPWLGRCVYDLVCGPNEYGDPANGISCQPCPCPLGSPSNQFSSSCYLDGDGQVTCNCQQGYSGRRCQYCASGYEGNPTVPGDYCKPAPVTCMTTFTCLDGSQHPWSRRCDGIKDCSQYEDESDCDVCFNSGHRCDDRRCVHFERICDGHPDCHDASDERPENCLDELPCDHIHQWTCADPSHQCIDRSRHCDGFYDCPDNSDERYCNCTCDSAFNFRCNDGTCLDVSVRCNGRVDCKDKSDEHLCPCDPQRYHTCGDGTCIDLYRVCDGNPDCRDRSDEPRWCGCNPNTMHRCGDGTCIEKSAVCDGRPNCRDFSDEPPTCWQNCDQTLEFTCATGNCIDIRLVCNGYTDCQDGSDEHYCIVCAENQFQCGDHSCVDRQRLCDGRPDCRDQSDEGERAGCCVAPYFFRCHDGYCIESQHVCNGYWDCGDGSDERFCSGRCDPAGSIEADPVYGNCQCKEFVTGPQCDQCKEDAFYLSERNKEGCIPCFCMGITSSCSSSNLHRQQEYTYFTNDRQGFEIVDGNLQNFIRDDLFVDSNRQELVFRDFTRYGQKVYYWKLPQRFLGDKVTSYGGNLTYTLRFVPAPGGQSSTNSAYDVEIFGNDILLRHFKQGQSSLSPARQETISVPLYEQYWQRQNGQEVNREHLMMALADLEYIYIKATYTTATEEVGLKDVTLDYAEARNTGQERAYAVEMCDCPREYQGTSCEDCAIGYTRSTSGVHLGTCVPCDCSGHSTECDPDTGVCFNCKNNTAGNHCELCAPGYTLYGDTCYHTDSGSECICDPRGNLSCEGNRCQCKAHVIGTQCESCRPGYYHLSADNPVGCLPCWCSGVTSQCFSSNYYRMQIPMQLLFDHGFTFSNRLQTDVIKEGLDINLANNEISFSNFNNLRNREPYYWSLPQMFTGNRLESYGGSLTVTQKFQIQPGAGIYLEADVIIRSTSGREFFWMRPRHLQQNIPDREQTYTVLLTEDSFTMNQQPASRSEFLKALSSIEAILIRATLSEQMVATFLSDVIMDTAVPTQTGQPRAVEVEQCQCPMEYSGLSCETCKAGYYRKESTNQCLQCPCNGHESYCAERPDGSVQCECLPGYYGPSCAESGRIDS